MNRVAKMISALLFVILPLSTGSLAQNKKKLNREWLAKDIEAVQLISKITPIESMSVEYIKTILGDNTGYEEEYLGFGAKRFNLGKGNGYTSFYVDAFTFNGTVGYYEVGVRGSLDSWSKIRKQIIKVWKQSDGPEFEESDYGFASRKMFDSVLQSYKTAVGAELGEMSHLEIPPQLKEHYEYLISPMHNSYIGEGACGYGGSILEGRIAIDALVDAGRMDLIENVLRGYNPGGRVYAALVLLRMKREGIELSVEAQDTLNKVLELPVRVSTCSGCIVNSGLTAKDVVRTYMEK